MIIRAIDPGPAKSAYVDWDGDNIINFDILDNDGYNPKLENADIKIVIEMIASYGMPVGKDVFETVWWIGRIQERYNRLGYETHRMYRKDVKMHLCGSARAKDSNIVTAIVDRFDPNREFGNYGKGTKKNPGMFYGFSKDVWQAFALALTFYDTMLAPTD